MTSITQEKVKSNRILAYVAVLIALSSPLLQMAMRPFFELFPYPVDRFVSIWVFWIAGAVVLFISVRIEGIPLETFGITRNTRSLRYRLIEMIGALLLSLVVAAVLVLFSNAVRALLNAPSNAFNPSTIPPFWVMLPAWITATFMEELLFRSYPIERLLMLTGNRWLAAIVTCLAFSFLHLFAWDIIHVMTFVLPGSIMLTGLYMWRRSLWFVMIIHAVINLPLLFLPLLAPFL